MVSPTAKPQIVFRHRGRTIDVFDTEDGWHFMVEGDRTPSRKLSSPGRAIEGGIRIAEAKARRQARPKVSPGRTVSAFVRKL